MNGKHPDPHQLARWRLVLGKEAEEHGVGLGDEDQCQRVESLVGFLFDEGHGPAGKRGAADGASDDRSGGSGPSTMTIPTWIDGVAELFPQRAKEVMERELVTRRGIAELLDQPKLLEKIEPNVELVKTILAHKDLLNPRTRILARKIIEQVVNDLKDKMKIQVETAITGAIRRDRHSPRKVFRNLDIKTTLRRNLANYDADNQRLLIDRSYFFASERNKRPWHIIIAVDQSGSMLDSAIFSAIMASIFYELPSINTSMFLFDTQVVDLTDQVGQPVDVLMQVQLGGGTDIAMAVAYANQLVREPARTIVVLITDFYEGGSERALIKLTGEMAQAGTRMIGLGALGYDAKPSYNRSTARRLRKAGMDILVCTPETLAECMGEIIRG